MEGGRAGHRFEDTRTSHKQCKQKASWLVDLFKGRKGTILRFAISYRLSRLLCPIGGIPITINEP